jgi:hypothetical protein
MSMREGILPAVGTHVELAPHLDAWMRGDRYGAVVGYGYTRTNFGQRRIVRVKLDRSGRTAHILPGDLTAIA